MIFQIAGVAATVATVVPALTWLAAVSATKLFNNQAAELMIDGDLDRLKCFHTDGKSVEHYANLTIDKKRQVEAVNFLVRDGGYDFTG